MSHDHVPNRRYGSAVRASANTRGQVPHLRNADKTSSPTSDATDWSTVQSIPPFSIETDGHTYTFDNACYEGDMCDVFLGTKDDDDDIIALKIARSETDQDLVDNEARILAYLRPLAEAAEHTRKYMRYLPQLVKQITISTSREKRRANMLALDESVASHSRGYVSLEEVLRAYPKGVGPKTFAWMWRRVVEILSWIHAQGVVHGAVVPGNILIHPETHQAILLDWCYAEMTANGSYIKAGDMKYEKFYPSEVFDRLPASPAVDVYMIAKCGIALLGGDLEKNNIPDDVPEDIANELKVCMLWPHNRPTAERAYANMAATLAAHYGQPHYTAFVMPERE